MFYWIIKCLAWPFRRFYFRVDAQGIEHLPRRGPAIVVANHTSYLDAGILGSVLPRKIHFVVLSSMYRMWRLRWFYAGMETIPVDRGKAEHTPIRRALQVLGAGGVLGIFPEGGRSTSGRLRAPREGAALLARKSGAPVIPAGIRGAFEAFPPGRRWPRPRKIQVRFGVPLRWREPPGDLSEREALRAFSARMMEAIGSLQAGTNVPGPAAAREGEARF